MGRFSKIFALNGAASIIENVTTAFSFETARFMLISGPSGSGKSAVIEFIAEDFEQCSESNKVLVLTGDSGRSEQLHHPLESLRRTSRFVKLVGGFASVVFSDFFGNTAELMTRHVFRSLGSVDADGVDRSAAGFIDLVATLSTENRVLLLIDDIQFFDEASLTMVSQLIRTAMSKDWTGYPLRILAVQNSTFKPTRKRTLAKALRHFFLVGELNYCSIENFPKLLSAFGMKIPLTKEDQDLFYNCSGAHLEIVRTFVSDVNLSAVLSTAGFPGRPAAFFRHMMGSFLSDHLPEDGPIRVVLAAASIIGKECAPDDVSCVTTLSRDEVESAAALARELRVLTDEDSSIRFRHDITWEYFSQQNAGSKIKFHNRYAECLRVLRPSQYASRAKHLLLSRQHELAAIAYLHNVVQRIQSRLPGAVAMIDWRLEPWRRYGHFALFERKITQAYELCRAGSFTDAAELAESIDDCYPDSLRGERDLLLAECALQGLNLTSRTRAVALLEPWIDGLIEDREVWSRIMALSILANVQIGDFDKAHSLERTMFRQLHSFISRDSGIRSIVNRVSSYSNMHWSPEAARGRIKSIVESYRSGGLDKALEYANDYMVSLTNLSAVELELGDYKAAGQSAKIALSVFDTARAGMLQSPQPAANNLALAEFLSGGCSVDRLQRQLVEIAKFKNGEDCLLVRSNIIAAKIYAGDIAGAERDLAVHAQLTERIAGCDEYYLFFPLANHAMIDLLGGRSAEALRKIDACAAYLATMPPSCVPQLQRRQDALRTVAKGFRVFGSAHEIDAEIAAIDDVGAGRDGWRFWGRSGLFTSIEIWSRA